MKRVLLSAMPLAFVATAAVPNIAPPLNAHAVRVLTYNIHHGEGTDRNFDLVRLASIINSAGPDLVALQEVDQGTARSAGVNQLDELGRLTDMYATFGKAMDFQGGGYGVGVLSRLPIHGSENHPLPGASDREPRTALTVRVQIADGGPLIQFTSTHLDQGREVETRVAQADYLNQVLASDGGGPGILAGDMNTRPDTEVMQILGTRWTNASPVDPPPADGATRPFFGRVDYVLVRPAGSWRVIESTLIDAPLASDHRPVMAVVEWNPQP